MYNFKEGDVVRIRTDDEIDRYVFENPSEFKHVILMNPGATSSHSYKIISILPHGNKYPITIKKISKTNTKVHGSMASYSYWELELIYKNIKLYNYLLKQ